MSVDLLARAVNFEDTEHSVRSFLNGVVGSDWRQALIGRGYGWHVDVGAFSTPIVGGGNGTVLDQDQPEFGISVAAGYTIIPVRLDITVLPGLQTTDSHETEALIAVDRAAAWAADGTVTTETPINMRSNVATGCPASVFSAATANITNPTLGYELAHAAKLTDIQGTAATVNLMELKLTYEPKNPPLLVGPCAVYGYWGGDIAASGFANLDFIVVPSTWITPLS